MRPLYVYDESFSRPLILAGKKAFIVLAPGYEPSDALIREIQKHVKKVTAPYKYPRAIEFVDMLPKTISGKIRRAELRAKEMQKFLSDQENGGQKNN